MAVCKTCGEEVDELVASARHLAKQMRAIRETGKVLGLDRMAVMAALNITHECACRRTSPHSRATPISASWICSGA